MHENIACIYYVMDNLSDEKMTMLIAKVVVCIWMMHVISWLSYIIIMLGAS